MQRTEENNEVTAIVNMMVSGKRSRGRPKGRWSMPGTEHSGNQEFWPLTPPSGKMRRKRRRKKGSKEYILIKTYYGTHHITKLNYKISRALFAINRITHLLLYNEYN